MILDCTNTCDRHDPKGKGEARATFYEKITWQLRYSSKISVPDHHGMTHKPKRPFGTRVIFAESHQITVKTYGASLAAMRTEQ